MKRSSRPIATPQRPDLQQKFQEGLRQAQQAPEPALFIPEPAQHPRPNPATVQSPPRKKRG